MHHAQQDGHLLRSVVVLDPSELFQAAIRSSLGDIVAPSSIVTTSELEHGLRLIQTHEPELIIFDIWQRSGLCMDLAAQFRSNAPDARLVLITDHDDPADLLSLLQDGIDVCLRKADLCSEVLLAAVVGAYRANLIMIDRRLGDILQPHLLRRLRPPVAPSYPRLTEDEQKVLQALAQGMTGKEAALTFGLSRRTMDRRIESLKERSGAHTLFELGILAERSGLLDLPQTPSAS